MTAPFLSRHRRRPRLRGVAIAALWLLAVAPAAVPQSDLLGAAGHPSAAVLVGENATILFSTGNTHKVFQPAADIPGGVGHLNDVTWVGDVGSFVAVGDGGVILASNANLGNAWREVGRIGIKLRGVQAFDGAGGTRAVAVGFGGTIVRTTSPTLGGWVTEDVPVEAGDPDLWDVAQGPSVSVAVGKGGVILKGSREGTAWVVVASPTTADLHGVAVEQQGNFIAVGDSGKVLRGLADGVTWEVVATLDANALFDVVGEDFIPPSVTVGSPGVIWNSVDTGNTWTEQSTRVVTPLRCVAYTGVDFVTAGDGGVVVWSADGYVWEGVISVERVTWGRLKDWYHSR